MIMRYYAKDIFANHIADYNEYSIHGYDMRKRYYWIEITMLNGNKLSVCRETGTESIRINHCQLCRSAKFDAKNKYCKQCGICIDRMYEYFENPHPVYKSLSRVDYILPDRRRVALEKFSRRVRKRALAWMAPGRPELPWLPRELHWHILCMMISSILGPARVTWDEFVLAVR